jgi:hypothetical protein
LLITATLDAVQSVFKSNKNNLVSTKAFAALNLNGLHYQRPNQDGRPIMAVTDC